VAGKHVGNIFGNFQSTGCDKRLKKTIDKPQVVTACKQKIPCCQGRDLGLKIYSELPAEALGTFRCKPNIFGNRVRKANTSINGVK